MNKIKSIIAASIEVKTKLLANEVLINQAETVANLIVAAFKDGNRLYLCGNGGSAADAQHLAAEFTGRFYTDREPLPAEALHVNTSFLTAVANDYSYDQVYERAIKAHGRKGDILIGLSTSGNSKNIVLAQAEAARRGMIVISFTGATGGKMKDCCDFLFNIPSTDTPRIQECHIMLGHIICQLVEEKLFS
ncbi:MAG: D-sedoheptulose 7-phosphate isomerase [Chitinophagales bacterium]|nr:D-sedoheptulose 7-phosphate isomerase [Chitinophagales bacterium]